MKFYILLIISLACILGCTPKTKPINKYADNSLLAIAKYQDEGNTVKLIPYLKAKKPLHRIAAVRAFASIRDTAARQYLYVALFTDQEPDVRKIAAYSVGQMYDSSFAFDLMRALKLEIIPEVQGAILEAMGKCANKDVVAFLNAFTQKDKILKEAHVKSIFNAISVRKIGDKYAERCVQYFKDSSASDETKHFAVYCLSRLPKTQTKAYIDYFISVRDNANDRDMAIALDRLNGLFMESTLHEFNQNDFLDLLLSHPYSGTKQMTATDFGSARGLQFLIEQVKTSKFQIVKSTAADLYFRYVPNPATNANEMHNFIEYCLNSGDMGLISAAAIRIENDTDSSACLPHLPVLKTQLANLVLPRQLETYLDVSKAIARLEGQKFVKPITAYNHPIDWVTVKKIPAKQRVRIKTSKGDIVIELDVESAPGSVWNFLNSVDAKSYNNRYFHRVVPNFVIQGGCPRGDGWGAPDWTQRSEFSEQRPFVRGAVGLASVGNHTEGVQFFITHCRTPHLDGRYSVFGQVVEGLDVVDNIVVGDVILEVIRI